MLDLVKGTVTNVVDGDTFDINVERIGNHNKYQYNNNERVRIENIDTPELPSSAGVRAKIDLERAVLGKYVKCDIKARDKFGRLVSHVTIAQRPVAR